MLSPDGSLLTIDVGKRTAEAEVIEAIRSSYIHGWSAGGRQRERGVRRPRIRNGDGIRIEPGHRRHRGGNACKRSLRRVGNGYDLLLMLWRLLKTQ